MLLKSFVCCATILVALTPVLRASGSSASPTFTTIDIPGASSTTASGIGANGEIVGWYIDSATRHTFGFLLVRGEVTTFDEPNAYKGGYPFPNGTYPTGINSRGEIIGLYYTPVSSAPARHSFLLYKSTFRNIFFPDSILTSVAGVNAQGQIVGFRWIGNPYDFKSHGFLLDRGVVTNIDVPGATITFPTGIGDSGQIVGYYFAGHYIGFLSQSGTFTSFDVPGAGDTYPSGINARGQIVGYYANTSHHGFVLDDGVFTTIDFPGASETWAYGVNAGGQIVGSYKAGGTTHGFVRSR